MARGSQATLELKRPVAGWGLVTGASSGLGPRFARSLAARGYHVALTARREAPMRALAEELSRAFGVATCVEPLDLTAPGAAVTLQSRLDMRELAVTELTRRFGERMLAKGAGHILLVASLAAFHPAPLNATYAAAKAFVRSLGEALHVELGPTVGVTVLSPGLMDTGFLAAAGREPSPEMRRGMVSAEETVQAGLEALFAGRISVVPHRSHQLMALATRLTSRASQARYAFSKASL